LFTPHFIDLKGLTIDYQVIFPDNNPKSVLSGKFPMIIQYQVTFPDNNPKSVLSGKFPMIIQYRIILSRSHALRLVRQACYENHELRITHAFNNVNIFLRIFSDSAFKEQKKPDYPQITRLYYLIFFY